MPLEVQMAHVEAELSIMRGEGGRVVGLNVVAEPQTEAEFICWWMPKAILNKTASIEVAGGKLTLACPSIGSVSFPVPARDEEQIKSFISGVGEYSESKTKLYRSGILTPGFRMVIAGEEGRPEDPVIKSDR